MLARIFANAPTLSANADVCQHECTMLDSTTAAEQLRAIRMSLGLSQSWLARVSGLSRFKICTYELGDGGLNPEEERRLYDVLQVEADRLCGVAVHLSIQRSVLQTKKAV
jgi:predicted transcriptional regulator